LRNSEKTDGEKRRWGDLFENGKQEAECRRQMAESDDGEIGRNGEGENLKLRNSDCGIQRVRRGDKGIRISGHREK
jgi:hypothetical protein